MCRSYYDMYSYLMILYAGIHDWLLPFQQGDGCSTNNVKMCDHITPTLIIMPVCQSVVSRQKGILKYLIIYKCNGTIPVCSY